MFHFHIKDGRFTPDAYYVILVVYTHFRKYIDVLRMTLDCTEHLAGKIGTMLADAAQRGIARHGLHRQSDALVTCITPTMYGNHFHFIDGAAGGYAMAALILKA